MLEMSNGMCEGSRVINLPALLMPFPLRAIRVIVKLDSPINGDELVMKGREGLEAA